MLGYTENVWTTAGKIKAVICSSRFDYISDSLSQLGIWIFETQECADIDEPVSCHADMTYSYLGQGRIICHVSQQKTAVQLKAMGLDVTVGKSKLGKKYPNDIAYDFLMLEKYGIGYLKHTDKEILEYCAENDIITLNSKQGYSKCSCLAVDGNSIITADRSIAETAKKAGIDVLLISPGQISLPGYDSGFIGGCAGYISKNTLAFTGDIKKHSDFSKIDEFIRSKGRQYICLSDKPLVDIGGIIPIVEEY